LSYFTYIFHFALGNTNNDFTINNATGVISLARSLNSESTVHYDLIILVSDGGTPKRSSQVSISIVVTAINEFTPTFANNGFYNITLNEDVAVGTTVLTVHAQDSDSGEQGHVIYTLVSGDVGGVFQLGVKTGEIVLKRALDFETNSFHNLIIRASDSSTPSSLAKSSDATVNITITDLNDNPPVCQENFKVLTLLESTVVGTIVFKANCSDSDSANSGSLSYQILTGNDEMKFNVTPSGDVILVSALNIEHTSMYNLILMVMDAGVPSKSNSISLTIDVQPVNEYVPTFAQGNHYQLDVLENITIGKDA
jgi:hypothetical protein